jgi:hypothetical protein
VSSPIQSIQVLATFNLPNVAVTVQLSKGCISLLYLL